MKFAVVQFEYNVARVGNPYLFTVEGTPDTLAEWKSFGGTTRETLTLAECEAKGITLPVAIGTAATEAAKRADALSADNLAKQDALDAANAALSAKSGDLDAALARIAELTAQLDALAAPQE